MRTSAGFNSATPPGPRWRRLRFPTLMAFGLLPFWLPLVRAGAEPVTFVFRLPPDARNPFARIIWAEVVTPAHETLRLPAFFTGDGRFAVRARADRKGDYRLGPVTEEIHGQTVTLTPALVSRDRVRVHEVEGLPAVRCAAGQPARLVLTSGAVYTPIGANLAWSDKDRVAFHLRALEAFSRAGLNWTRIWMVHWSGLNLDWLPEDLGPSPPPGCLDLRVAADWDRIVAQAEGKGVYLQIVLQHHGQYSTVADSSWRQNPWNAANPGGFLAAAADFFTSPVARELTAQKYRYVVARWGYSPAVLAWELFNEVHWTDAIERAHDEAAVARWHAEMASRLRAADPYHHLVTTSTENLRSPIYAAMDYFQPHLYPANILAGVRFFDPPPDRLDRPVFCGEFGDNHMPLTPEQKASGVAIVPPVWASLMGGGRYPAQPWVGEQLIKLGRLNELGAVARFLAATGLGGRDGLTAFSPVVDCATRVPLVLGGGQVWQRRPDPEITVPLDGREPAAFADIPRILVGSPSTSVDRYPGRATYHFELPRTVTIRLQIADTGAAGAAIRATLDGTIVAAHSWPPHPAGSGAAAPTALELPFPADAGAHTLVVDNPGGPDWVDVAGIDFGLDLPALAAVGKRGRDFLALWVWHRTGVMALTTTMPARGTLVLEDVPAGTWRVTWWNTLAGVPATPVIIRHPGGTLRLPTPPISRHAAVVLTR